MADGDGALVEEAPLQRRRRHQDAPPPALVDEGGGQNNPANVYRNRRHFTPSNPMDVVSGDLPGLHNAGIRDIIDPGAERREANDPIVNLLNEITVGYTYGKDLAGFKDDVERLASHVELKSALLTAISFTVDMRRFNRFSQVREVIENWICKAATRADLTTQEALQIMSYVNGQMPGIENKLAEGPPKNASFQHPEMVMDQVNWAETMRQREAEKSQPNISQQDQEMVNKMIERQRKELEAVQKQFKSPVVDVDSSTGGKLNT